MMTRLLLYAYAIGIRSSRRIEKCTYDDLGFRYLSADQHSDHDTIAAFRQQHLGALSALFVQALQLCRRTGLVRLGTLAIDGTKIQTNASVSRSLRHQRLCEEEQRLQKLMKHLLQEAAETDAEDARWGKGEPADPLPPHLAKAEERLQRIRQAKLELEQEAQRRLAELSAEHPPQKAGRPRKRTSPKCSAEERARHRKARQRICAAMAGQTRHYNLTDPDSRVMQDNGLKAIVQSYNAQLAVDGHAQIIVETEVTQHVNDKQQLAPMAKAPQQPLGALPEAVLADAGYWSYEQLAEVARAGMQALVSPDAVYRPGKSRVRADHPLVREMREKLASAGGRALYALRKAIVEPVVGHVKAQRCFRRFSCRGLTKVQREWK
jgi:hypothetical protein